MSLILDALKRAERERRSDASPAPPDVAMPAAGAPSRAPRWRLVALAAVVVVAAVAGAWAWKTFRQVPAPAVADSAPAPQPAAPAPVIMARPPPADTTPAIVPGTEDVASLDDLTDEPVLEAEPPATAPVPAIPPPQAPAPNPDIRTTPLEPATPKPQAEPEPQAATPAPAQIPPALTVPAPLRKFREMPPDYRADFPALKIEIHVYEKAPQQRFVMVNGKRYREGERLNEGPQLVEIVPDGLVLEFRGEKVLYTLGR
jgi:general secretion pathway protein B